MVSESFRWLCPGCRYGGLLVVALLLSGLAAPAVAADRHTAALSRCEVEHDLHGRRLARPVRSEEPGHSPRSGHERQVAHDGALAVPLREVLDLDRERLTASCVKLSGGGDCSDADSHPHDLIWSARRDTVGDRNGLAAALFRSQRAPPGLASVDAGLEVVAVVAAGPRVPSDHGSQARAGR